MHPGKIVLIVTWAYGLGSFFIAPDSTAAAVGRVIFWGMAAIHVVECLVFLPALRRAGGSLASHAAQVFAFGFLHLREIGAIGGSGEPKP
jgi:uncharacterized protein YhhL (DUF1145 family)